MRRSGIVLLLTAGLTLLSGVSHGASWKCKAVDKGVDGGNVEPYFSIAVTSDGKPRIAYAYTIDLDWNVRYAYRDETGWHIEGIARGDSPSLALNPAGNPRIGYGDRTLFYVYNDGIDWASTDALKNAFVYPKGVSLKLGSTSQGCMSYVCPVNGTLQYVYQDGSGWHPINADDPDHKASSSWTSLALDGSTPHIAYGQRDGEDHNLRHAWRNGTVWTHETVDAVGNAGGDYSPLVLDRNGKLQIAYWQTGGASNLRYAWKTGEGWQKETVAGGLRDGEGSVDLAVDSSGRPAVAYTGGTTYATYYEDLKFAYRDDSGWHAETVDNYWWGGLSLAMDQQNRPHIAYRGPCGMMYATPGSGLVINSEVPRIDLTYIDFETSIYWSFPGISGRVDAYMAARLPDGTLLFFDPQLQLTPTAVPVARGVTVGGDARGWLLLEYWFLPPKGTYTLMAVCVPAGKSVLSSSNWLGDGIDEDTLVVDYETPWWW